MDITTIYPLLVLVGLVVCVAIGCTGRGPTRTCPQCGRDVSMTARGCRDCHYRFT
jgi:hypothetical protein